MKTKAIALIVLFTLCISGLRAEEKIKGNGKIETRTIQIDEYDQLILGERIEFKGTSGINFKKNKKRSPKFHYRQSNAGPKLIITMDENLFAWLVIDQKEGKIRLKADEGYKIVPTEMVVRSSSENLTSVKISGCMDFTNEEKLSVDNLRLSVDGVGDIRLSGLTAKEITANVSGVGNIHLSGEADKGSYEVSGVGKVYAFDCNVKNLYCEVSGVGNMEVMASDQLKAETSGVGNIRYKGQAEVNASSSGIGKVKNAN